MKTQTKNTVLVCLFAAGFVLAGMATGPAYADFGKDHLVFVVFNPSGTEILVDLGVIGVDIDFAAENVTVGNASPNGMVQANAYSFNDSTYLNCYATDSMTAPGINSTSITNFGSAGNNVSLGGFASGVAHSVGETNSFVNAFGGNGGYALLNPDSSAGTILLGDIAAQPVDLYLYCYDIVTLDPGPNAATPYAAVLRFTDTGDIILNPGTAAHEISGLVRSSVLGYDAGVKDAVVRLEGTDHTTTTAQDGSFVLAGVPDGNYTLHVSAPSFKPFSQPVAVSGGNVAAIDIGLAVGAGGDIGGDGVIGLEEAIHALRVAAGIKD